MWLEISGFGQGRGGHTSACVCVCACGWVGGFVHPQESWRMTPRGAHIVLSSKTFGKGSVDESWCTAGFMRGEKGG